MDPQRKKFDPSAHPEINRFDQDRFVLHPAVEKYLKTFHEMFPEVEKGLMNFRQLFTSIKNFDRISASNLKTSGNFSYSPDQKSYTFESLDRLAENFPVPKILKGKIEPGLYLNLREEENNEKFISSLDELIAKVKNMPARSKVNFDLSQVGKIPLVPIHENNSKKFFDPYLQGKIKNMWTMDITKNPGLSIKDTMALNMIQDGIDNGKIQPDTILVEGTSGSTGAGMAIFAAYFGLKIILAIPSKQSQEKINRLRSLGAHVVVTPTKVEANDPKSYYSVRDYLAKASNGWKASQYDNLANRRAHEKITGPQIWEETKGEVTTVVATAGTCGTISGIGEYLKKKNPNIKMIAVDTVGSILYLLHQGYTIEEVEKYAKGYLIQGFGEDIHPQNLDNSVIDHFIRVSDASGLNMARMLPALGFVAGQSSGAAYAGVLQALDSGIINKDDNVVTIFPDTGIVYRHDIFNDEWMKENGMM